MNDKVLLVFTYAGQQAIIDRHLPYFRRGKADILFVYPVDAPLRVPAGCEGFATGKSEHFGKELMWRMTTGIRIAARMYKTIVVVEGDSIVLGLIPDAPLTGIDCFLWDNGEPHFKAKQYCHWPWLMSDETALKISSELFPAMLQSGDHERGLPDRMLGWACEKNGIPMRHRPDMTYSRNRLDQPQFIEEARSAIAHGAVFVHGLKTQAELDAVTR